MFIKHISWVVIFVVILCTIINNTKIILFLIILSLIFLGISAILAFVSKKKCQVGKNNIKARQNYAQIFFYVILMIILLIHIVFLQNRYRNWQKYWGCDTQIEGSHNQSMMARYPPTQSTQTTQYTQPTSMPSSPPTNNTPKLISTTGYIYKQSSASTYIIKTSHGFIKTSFFPDEPYAPGQGVSFSGEFLCVLFPQPTTPSQLHSSLPPQSYSPSLSLPSSQPSLPSLGFLKSLVSFQITTFLQSIVIPYSYELYLYTNNIVGTLKLSSIQKTTQTTLINKHLSQNSSTTLFSSAYKGIPAGVLFGETDGISKGVYQDFIDSGLVYLVAASGGNISLLVSFVVLLFLMSKKRRQHIYGMIATILYTYKLRTNIALIRAFFGYMIMSVARMYGRVVSTTKILQRTILLCLLYDPYIVIGSRGFILSFAGVYGIVMTPVFLQEYRMLRHIAPTVRVFLALLGPLFVLTQKVNILTMVASLPASFITMIISYLSLYILFFGDSFVWIQKITLFLINILIKISHIIAENGVYIYFDDTMLGYSIWVIIWLCIYVFYSIGYKKKILHDIIKRKVVKSCHK